MVAAETVPIVVELAAERIGAALVGACGSRVVPVHADDIIAKVAAQACYQAGLGAVYRELLDFDGDEIYTVAAGAAAGHEFGELVLAYDGCTLLGVQREDGSLALCPDMSLPIGSGDSLLLVAEDDSAISFGEPAAVGYQAAPASSGLAVAKAPVSRLLIIGWSDLGQRIIRSLDAVMSRSVEMRIVVDPAVVEPATVVVPGGRMTVEVVADDGVSDAADGGYDQVFVLGYRGHLPASDADARTLLTLVTLNRTFESLDDAPRVVAEILESRTVPIAAATGVDDFVVSDELASLLISQLAENPALAAVFDELFSEGGSTIMMQAAIPYLSEGEHPWGSIVLAARTYGDVALGFRNEGEPVVVNPRHSHTVLVGDGTDLIVLTRRPAFQPEATVVVTDR
jgi:hypothetical protein